MKSARNQLILLGFICQGLTWDDYFLPLANILLWVLCLTRLRGKLRLGVGGECLLMLAGATVSLLVGRKFGFDTHYFIGHGLTLMQAARLTRTLDRREKIFSILMACFQLGVGCTFLFDLRFIPVFLGMAVLFPGAFRELEAETFTLAGPATRPRWNVASIAIIFAIAVGFFLAFPRGSFGGAIQSLRAGSADQTSLLDAVVDPTRSVSAQSRRVLLQIQGEKMGYLRCYSLSEFDGISWTPAPDSGFDLRSIRPPSAEAEARILPRRVSVKQVAYLGRILPTDGLVVRLEGKFFRNPARNGQDAIECQAMRNTANNIYDYWIDPHPEPEPLSVSTRWHMTRLPPQSARLHAWLDNIVAGETNSAKIARRLETYLGQNFKYVLGGPALNRLDPVDDFVFNQKQGHCERFASTLALLLRLKDIPSRVVIGYLPHHRGGVDGWYSVRFNDAHAWTEAYLTGLGWVTLDATPAATMPDTGWRINEWWDTLDLAWNLHVVNFDGASQRYLLSSSIQGAAQAFGWAWGNALLPGAIAVVALVVAVWFWIRSRGKKMVKAVTSREQARITASHYYGQMLRALAKQGIHRREPQTPLEFLDQLASQARPWLPDAQLITRTFCETRYGNQNVTQELGARIEAALKRIADSRTGKGA